MPPKLYRDTINQMPEIRAFVGHSFNSEDAGVVNAFLAYFDELQRVLPSFSWVHAQEAEPRELAQKVLSLIADRNVFIGICTGKELVVGPSKVQRTFIQSGWLKGKSADFEWKTSDWVIQEIGLAKGRAMSVVILLEEGCRKPGGLQGDVEFIAFDREAPEKAFVKLLQMIRALSPASSPSGIQTTEGPQERTEDAPVTSVRKEDEAPDATWDRERYETAFLWRLLDDKETLAEIDEAYLKTDEAKDEEKKAEWQAITESWRLATHRGGSLDQLKALAGRFPKNVEILSRLSRALSRFGSHIEAGEVCLRAADAASPDSVEAVQMRAKAAIQFAQADRLDLATPNLESVREWVRTHPGSEMEVLSPLREIATATKDENLAIEVMERIVELRPDDFDTRFSLAYSHSQNDNKDLALYHYLQIPGADRTAIAWNNLGVSFQSFSMQAKAVEAYRTAATSGETLAMSNLAYKLMQAGFVKEAEEEFKKAMQIDNFHRNVGEGIASLRDIPEKEDEKQSEALEKAKPKIEYYKKLGRAVAQPTVSALPATWRGPNCDLTIGITGDDFRAAGSYERTPNALGLLGGLGGGGKPTHHTIEYSGKIVGCRIDGTIKRTSDSEQSPSILSLGLMDNNVKFSMIIDLAVGKIEVMENPSSLSPSFYDLTIV